MVFSVPSSELQPLAPLTQKLEQGMMINSEGFLGGEQSDQRLEALTEVADERVVGLIDDEDDFASNLSLFRENEAVTSAQICGTPAKNLAYKQLEGVHVITPEKTTGRESVPPVSTIDTPVTPKKTTFLKRVSPASNNETPVKKGKGPLISRSPVEARHLVLDNDSKRLLEERFARESLIRRAECRNLGNSEHQIRILQQEISKVNQVRVQEKEDFIRLIKSNGWEPQRAFIDPAMQKIWNIAQGPQHVNKTTTNTSDYQVLRGVTAKRFENILKMGSNLAARKK